MSSTAQARLTAISRWVDDAEVNLGRDPEALSWHRVAKVGEEAGEVIAAMIGWTGGNPRKGKTHDRGDVMAELLDTALAALAAYEHLTGNAGVALERLEGKIGQVAVRAGLEDVSPEPTPEPGVLIPPKVKVYFLNGPHRGMVADFPRPLPKRVMVGREMYEMITDPEDGRPLDGYVLVTGEPAVIEAKPRKGGAEDIATEESR